MKFKKLEDFASDKDIISFLESKIANIELLDECRLYSEEQMVFFDDLFIYLS